MGKVDFDKDGNMWMDRDIKFGGQLTPKLKPREWFYLVWEATKESREKYNLDFNRIRKSWLGSPATQWRIKNQLTDKVYL